MPHRHLLEEIGNRNLTQLESQFGFYCSELSGGSYWEDFLFLIKGVL
jgi:hypothetical protein